MGLWDWVKKTFKETVNIGKQIGGSLGAVIKGVVKQGKEVIGTIYKDGRAIVQWGGKQVEKVIDKGGKVLDDITGIFKSPLTWIALAIGGVVALKFL